MDKFIDEVEKSYLKKGIPELRPGDRVRVYSKLQEGDKERVQYFEGIIIRRKRGGGRATITVRKISYGVGVERIFPIHSQTIEKIEILQRGRVRKARLYYLRDLTGKSARIKGRKLEGLEQIIKDEQPPQEKEETPQ